MEKSEVIQLRREYLSRNDLRAMSVGQAIEFVLPDSKLESGKQTCYQMRFEKKEFVPRINIENHTLTVTRVK